MGYPVNVPCPFCIFSVSNTIALPLYPILISISFHSYLIPYLYSKGDIVPWKPFFSLSHLYLRLDGTERTHLNCSRWTWF